MGESILGVSSQTAKRIADRVGTPVYVYNAELIRSQFACLKEALGDIPHRVFYSVKANSSLAILDQIRLLGAGVDIVSEGELVRSLRAGFAPGDIVFSGVGKSAGELTRAISTRIGLVNVESSGELSLLQQLAEDAGMECNVGIRVNPDVVTTSHPYIRTGHEGLKFGVSLTEVATLSARVSSHPLLRLRSIGMHIGSQITDPQPYREAAARLARVVRDLGGGAGDLEFVSVGGGIGIQYTDEQPLSASDFVTAIRPLWETLRLPIAVEPGRFLVGNSGCLLTTCLYTKGSGNTGFVVVDAGMNTFLRPSLYGAKHAIRVVSPSVEREVVDPFAKVHVVGPICESGDTFGVYAGLAGAGPGALLALLGVGAYGFSMSSTYNSRPRPPEVLVDGAEWYVIRDGETLEDLTRGERLPPGAQVDRAAGQ